ncbi:MAG: hypothetical protein EA423_08285 [Phycisphaerales bacterium]|nr:MAG: hypothetical protein EA423_08285 [Phycisphaerales bacterium]
MANLDAPLPGSLLAQAGSTAAGEIVLWVGLLIVALIVGAGLIMMLRNRALRSADDASTDKGVFDSLRKMHERGELSDEEFNAARDSIIRRLRTKPRSENIESPQNGGVKSVMPADQQGEVPSPKADESERVFRAKPGHDLFGRPLPGSGGAGNDGPDAGPPKKPEK